MTKNSDRPTRTEGERDFFPCNSASFMIPSKCFICSLAKVGPSLTFFISCSRDIPSGVCWDFERIVRRHESGSTRIGEMSRDAILEKVQQLLEPILADLTLELVDLEFKREGRDWFLRIFIDKPGGVTLDDCAEVSRGIGAVLEVEDVIETAYRLEVSSPGLDRPLKKPGDFERYRGSKVKIKTFEKMDPDGRGHERKTFVGELLGFEEGRVRILQLDKKGGVVAFSLDAIAKANLEFDF